ncbi:hypothetical protein SDC9_187635 [bioreactor metagenome]|uniref:Fibronectin type-III domain-containing protein n=1 Tax=bioreactor metagenome TaxID=1076179 RepID=A0A645HMQ2_9ZZZZ
MIELGWSQQDILNQVDYTRMKNAEGQAYFRTENVLSNTKGILQALEKYYKYPAKLPAMIWLSDSVPGKPYDLRAEKMSDGSFQLKWEVENQDARVTFNVYRSDSEELSTDKAENILAVGLKQPLINLIVPDTDEAFYYYITVSDSYHNESEVSTPAFFYHSEMVK